MKTRNKTKNPKDYSSGFTICGNPGRILNPPGAYDDVRLPRGIQAKKAQKAAKTSAKYSLPNRSTGIHVAYSLHDFLQKMVN